MAEAGAEEAPAAPADLAPAPVPGGSSSVGSWPDFAVVCSFLERYGAALDLPELTFPELEEALEETGAVSRALVELHLKLMRKIGKSVTFDRWEKYLVRICQDYNSTWAWEMEKKGYLEMGVECKVGILKHLCECQFDDNLKFKNAINEEDADAMRVQPIGRDKDGLMYWYQLDQDHNIRVYIEEQDDQDGSSWKCIVRTRNELAEILELLKAQIDPALLKKSEPEEDSSQNPNPDGDDIKKEENGEKTTEDVEMKEEKLDVVNKQESDCPTENGSNCKSDGERPCEIKVEPPSGTEDEKQSSKDKDSFKENIKPEKTELKDLKEPKGSSEKTPSPQDPERAEVSVIVKRTEEHVEKPVEDTGKMKNDHQAKIPLKKRELKLTDDFDGPVKSAICKSKTPTKELLQKEEGKIEDDGTKAADGKQLVNGELNSDKVHKAKVDHAEDTATAPRESVIECTKDENGITNEKRNSSVIKSLQEVKEKGETKVIDALEKSATDLSNDRSSPPVQESSQKTSAAVKKSEVDSSKSDAVTKADKKAEKTMKEKPPQDEAEKDASHSETTKEPEAVAEIVSAESKEVSQTTEQSVSNEKAEELRDEGAKTESESKEKDGKNKATRAKLPASKKSVTRNSAAKKEKSDVDPEEPDNGVKEEPEPAEKEETEGKHTPVIKEKKTFPLRSKRKTAVKESESSETKDERDDQKAEAAEGDQEKTSVKPSSVSRSKNKLKAITEEENSGSEGKEMTSERQKDGIKLTIRISNKRRRPELPVENVVVEDVEEENIGRRLRRSPRISRPSAKEVEVKPRKPEKKESDDEESLPPAKPEKEEKKSEKEPSQQTKKKSKPRRRARWTNTRSRRKRKSSSEEETEESDSEEDSEEGSEEEKEEGAQAEDDPCKKCGLPNHPELILLCDSCDSGYHTACLRPPLMLIPDGEWFCPPCQHKLLCEKLEEQLQNLDVVLKKKERAERRKERLVYVGISIENIIPSQEQEEETVVPEKEEKKKKKAKPLERRSTRTRKFISYRFDEFDEAIDEAIEDDIRDADGGGGGGGGGRGKDMSNITGHRGKDISTILEGEREEGKRPQRAVTRRKKRRRLNDLDSDSNMDEEESEDEFRISEGSQEEFVVSENVEESEDLPSNDSDFGARRPRRHYSRPVRQSRRIKRRSVRRRYSDDDEDDDDESDDESQATETDNSSDYSDDYLDTRRRRSRRNQKRQVNYKEDDSDSDGSRKRGARHGRGKEMRRVLKRRFSTSESNESDASRSSEEKPRNVRKNLLRKRIRSSDEEPSDEEEEEKPVRKRLNRIETDDEDEEEGDSKVCSSDKPPPSEEKPPVPSPAPTAATAPPEGTKKPSYRIESDDEDDFETVTKDGSPLDYSLVDLPSANGQSPEKSIETLIGKPSEKSETTKDISAPVSQASNGTGGSQEAAGAEEDEDELLRVTDLVDYVCNSEQL
ncbi:remodeling and spacing factor 1 [Hyla sarda]|uniref:remodeling and spacing factor 1 n=1 Tax=Hyla sarda TaxID=327740 RepID=UPI0024C453A0|nr:remodeling and spacing factor 1 [Hyla sarda]